MRLLRNLRFNAVAFTICLLFPVFLSSSGRDQVTRPAITITSLPGGVENSSYSATLSVSGGMQPYRWTITSGSLPVGLTLNTNGTISGSPSMTGTYSFSVEVSDSQTPPAKATANLSIAIRSDLEKLKTLISFSQSLSEWVVIMIGGSIAALLGTSYWRPSKRKIRLIYLCFVPAWILLFLSVRKGVAAQQNCLALLLLGHPDVAAAKSALNDNIARQLDYMEIGILILGVWLVSYLLWWIFDDSIKASESS